MITRRTLAAICVTAVGVLGVACQPKLGERAQRFDQIPDWTGQWEIVGVTLNAAGSIEESLADELKVIHEQWGDPPYRPEVKPIFDAVAAQVHQQSLDDVAYKANPGLTRPTCSFGFPMVMLQSPLMFEAISTPEETAMVFSGREVRHIYTDGRPHTPEDELWATQWGDSIGHWDNGTLVADTIAVEMPPDFGGLPPLIYAWGGDNSFELVAIFSRDARFEERIRMLDHDHLEDRMTIDDPKTLTKAWTISRQYRRVTRLNRMVHEDCVGEERNPIVGGRYTLAPPPPPAPSLPPPFN
jgi:hypothetical protein